MLHLQMPTDMFGTLRCADESGVSAGLVYAGGIQDPPIQNIGFAVAQALKWDNADAVMLPYTLVVRSICRTLEVKTRQPGGWNPIGGLCQETPPS